MTGFVSQDRPQYRFYKSEPCRKINVEQSIYDLVTVTNKDNSGWTAARYFNCTWTFGQLKNLTDQLADAFVKAGLKPDETVLIALNSGMESLLCLLAINKIGAISKWVDLRAGEEDFAEYITASNCRFFVVYEPIIPACCEAASMVETVITVSPAEMLPHMARLAYNLKNPNKDRDRIKAKKAVVSFRQFLSTGDPRNDFAQRPFDRTRPSVIIQSSGTTGKPKSIVHSDYSIINNVRSMTYCDTPVLPQESVLANLPPWLAYTLGQGILWPLACGASVVFEPFFIKPESLYKNLGKFTVSFGAPVLYRYMLNNYDSFSDKKKKEISQVKAFVSGGDKISPDENELLDRTFGTPVINGYGSNECVGCLTINCVGHNKYGSVGIPKHGDVIISYDNDKQCELPYGVVGEICACTDSMFLYYDGNEEETGIVKRVHPDGKTWIHTGDLGIIDEEGFVFLKGRIRRVIVRKGFKISAYTIEDAITKMPEIKECAAVQVDDEEDGHVPMVFVVPAEPGAIAPEEFKKLILARCKVALKSYEIPKHIMIEEALPYTANNKYDFKKLEERGNEYVASLKE